MIAEAFNFCVGPGASKKISSKANRQVALVLKFPIVARRWPSVRFRGVDFGNIFCNDPYGILMVHGMVTCFFWVVHHQPYLSQLQVPQVSLTLRMTHAAMTPSLWQSTSSWKPHWQLRDIWSSRPAPAVLLVRPRPESCASISHLILRVHHTMDPRGTWSLYYTLWLG